MLLQSRQEGTRHSPMLRNPLTPIDDDTEEAPWMMMGTPQFRAADRFFNAVELEMEQQDDFLVAAMLPILFQPDPRRQVRTLSPDLMVARVPSGDRQSYDVSKEGMPPDFVLEVVSPESHLRDVNLKPGWYEVMGVREYAIFDPRARDSRTGDTPKLQGYRRSASADNFIAWEPDASGRLFSEVLELWLAVRDGELRAQRPDGGWVPTQREERAARQAAEARAAELGAENARPRDELSRSLDRDVLRT